MTKVIILLISLLFPFSLQGKCLKTAHTLQGKLVKIRCGSPDKMFACPLGRAWDGRSCIKVPIIERCKQQKGKWVNVQYMYNNKQSIFVDTCRCPQGLTWSGMNCIQTSSQNYCTSYSPDCIKTHKRVIQKYVSPQVSIKCLSFAQCLEGKE